MRIKSLNLTNWRNFLDKKIDFNSTIVLVGKNGRSIYNREIHNGSVFVQRKIYKIWPWFIANQIAEQQDSCKSHQPYL